MKNTALAALIIACSIPASVSAATGEPGHLTLTFSTGATSGAVMVSLFDSEGAYEKGTPARTARIDVAKGERTTIFSDLKEGSYAIKAFHDVNGDGQMNTNPFGVPIEPIAFSNNAPADMGPAEWDLARTAVKGATAQTIEIR
jgi:uncharacterized protein (DUF2141 family)